MKTAFVTDLLSEQTITSFFLVHEKEVRNTREGQSYLRLELGDRSGTIEARMWEQFEVVAKDVNRDDFVKVQARVEIYRNKPQLALVASPSRQARRNRSRRLSAAHHGRRGKAVGAVARICQLHSQSVAKETSHWRSSPIPAIARCYKRAPAAKVMHHAYLGGLLEHVIGLCGMAKLVAQHYPELDVDLLLTAAISS